MTRPAIERLIDELKIIDTDAHISEPHDLWTSRVPASQRERVPHVKEIEGVRHWVVAGDVDMGKAGPASVVRADGRKSQEIEFMEWEMEDVHVASSDMQARLEVLDRFGLYAQIIYPNLAGFGNQNFLKVDDAELRRYCVRVYNEAMCEIQRDTGGRILPMALVPWWDIAACTETVQQARDDGMHGIVMCSDPDSIGLPDLGDPAWEPFWAACNDTRMPVNFHIGASETAFNMFGRAAWPSTTPAQKLALGSTMLFVENARVLGNVLYSGLLERFPDVRIVSVESGIGWIPFILEALDYEMSETGSNHGQLKMLLSEYFRRQVYGCFWFEETAPKQLIEKVGVNNVLFETDFPHPTCLYPNSREHLLDVMADLDEHTIRRVLQDNASELYGIPVA